VLRGRVLRARPERRSCASAGIAVAALSFAQETSASVDATNADLLRMGGKVVAPADGDLHSLIRRLFPMPR
jgi:hypothetical protein